MAFLAVVLTPAISETAEFSFLFAQGDPPTVCSYPSGLCDIRKFHVAVVNDLENY